MRAPVCLCLSALAFSGCAAVDVRAVGSDPAAPPVYELRGTTLQALGRQAQQLCPNGHDVLRRWEHVHALAADANRAERWLHGAGSFVGAIEADRAQLTVQCNDH